MLLVAAGHTAADMGALARPARHFTRCGCPAACHPTAPHRHPVRLLPCRTACRAAAWLQPSLRPVARCRPLGGSCSTGGRYAHERAAWLSGVPPLRSVGRPGAAVPASGAGGGRRRAGDPAGKWDLLAVGGTLHTLGRTELWRWTMAELGVPQALNELVLLLRVLGGAAMLGNVCATPPASNHPSTHAPSPPSWQPAPASVLPWSMRG